jgi:hypothetical protein
MSWNCPLGKVFRRDKRTLGMNERMLEGHRLFAVEHRGEQALKGIDRPVQLLPVVQPSGVRGRLESGCGSAG